MVWAGSAELQERLSTHPPEGGGCADSLTGPHNSADPNASRSLLQAPRTLAGPGAHQGPSTPLPLRVPFPGPGMPIPEIPAGLTPLRGLPGSPVSAASAAPAILNRSVLLNTKHWLL